MLAPLTLYACNGMVSFSTAPPGTRLSLTLIISAQSGRTSMTGAMLATAAFHCGLGDCWRRAGNCRSTAARQRTSLLDGSVGQSSNRQGSALPQRASLSALLTNGQRPP